MHNKYPNEDPNIIDSLLKDIEIIKTRTNEKKSPNNSEPTNLGNAALNESVVIIPYSGTEDPTKDKPEQISMSNNEVRINLPA